MPRPVRPMARTVIAVFMHSSPRFLRDLRRPYEEVATPILQFREASMTVAPWGAVGPIPNRAPLVQARPPFYSPHRLMSLADGGIWRRKGNALLSLQGRMASM